MAEADGFDGANVFINCPFSDDFSALFEAILFAVIDCGARPRSALEAIDGAEVRLAKIVELVRQSKWAIHDISMMEQDATTGLARLNMAFELGIWIGAASFGRGRKDSRCLILDRDAYRYRAALSDISGQDIQAHGANPDRAIAAVRNFLNKFSQPFSLPGAAHISRRYGRYLRDRPLMLADLNMEAAELAYSDHIRVISTWLKTYG